MLDRRNKREPMTARAMLSSSIAMFGKLLSVHPAKSSTPGPERLARVECSRVVVATKSMGVVIALSGRVRVGATE